MAVATMSAEVKKYVCGHCDKAVSKTLYFKHKKLYYDRLSRSWRVTRLVSSVNQCEEFDFDENEQDDEDQDIEDEQGNSNTFVFSTALHQIFLCARDYCDTTEYYKRWTVV